MLLLMTTNGMTQTVNSLFNRYEDKPGAEYRNLGPLLMGFVADQSTMSLSFIVPLVSYVVVWAYAAKVLKDGEKSVFA